MSYLTSGFITLSKPIPFKPKKFKGSLIGDSSTSIKSTKEFCFYNLKHFKQEKGQEACKASKTPPLLLFINLLMKDGKKTHALRVLSMTLSLFKARISKIKLQKHVSSLKNSENFYRYFYNPENMPLQGFLWETSFSKKITTSYNIKTGSLFILFSKKSGEKKKGSRMLLNVIFPWYLNYKKPFPFIFNFSRVFDDFYKKKRFFCGKFLDLKQHALIKKNVQQFTTLHLFGPVEKRTNILLKNSKGAQCMQSAFEAWGDFVKKKTNTRACMHAYMHACSKGATKEQQRSDKVATKEQALVLKRNLGGNNSKNYLWYKGLAQKPRWEKLTSAQKSNFLFCLYKAISNVKPPLECRTKRIGGSNKQIPSQVSEHRQWGIAIRWIIEVAQNEFSKKKNRIAFYKPIKHSIWNNISKTSGNVQNRLKCPRGLALLKKTPLQNQQSQLGSWFLDEKTKFLSSLFQRKAKAGGLKVYSKKTRFYYFCFFLAESLENAYYKTGPAMQKRNLWVETALANRAFLRYRWW